MGAKFSKPTSNPLRNFNSFSCFKCGRSRQPSFYHNISPQPSIFATLTRRNVPRPNEFIHLFSNCISAATARTQEYLIFKDPEDKLRPSPEVLTQVFLMTYITRSVEVNLQDSLNCTVMTPEQRVLLGADWVWAVLERPTKNPKFQIVVQVLHLSEREEAEQKVSVDTCSESIQMAQMESSNNNTYERMVNFCTSIGKDCYALFLFFGKKNDKVNIYGVLSNNFEAAKGKCRIDRALIEKFFKGSRYLHTPLGMMQAIMTKNKGDPITVMIKFS
ncbi:unnamed protein product [Oreochromis niloticus]|nr:unnamed protein product [Mustela putorius furo]